MPFPLPGQPLPPGARPDDPLFPTQRIFNIKDVGFLPFQASDTAQFIENGKTKHQRFKTPRYGWAVQGMVRCECCALAWAYYRCVHCKRTCCVYCQAVRAGPVCCPDCLLAAKERAWESVLFTPPFRLLYERLYEYGGQFYLRRAPDHQDAPDQPEEQV